MLRIAGVLTLLVALYATLLWADANALRQRNLIDVANRQGALGVITLGVAVLISTGAMDLSSGSVVGLSAIGFGLLMGRGVQPVVAVGIVLAGGAAIGLVHGLLVTRLKLQSFLVTLCGLFVYRGIARYLTLSPVGVVGISTTNPSFRDPLNMLRAVLIGKDENSLLRFPMEIIVLLILATIIRL